MVRVTLDQFLGRVVVYERMPVEVSPGLRRSVWISCPVIASFATICHFFPNGEMLRDSLFFLWKQAWMADIWNFLATNRQVLFICNLVVLGLTLAMLIPTRLYRRGEIGLHVILFIPVVYASASLLFTLLLLVPVLVNLVFWVLIIVVAAFMTLAFLAILFGLFSRAIER